MNRPSLYDSFLKPPRDYSPAPIWWWSGEALDLKRLCWQMDRFVEGGVYNLVILNLAPTGPLYGSDQDSPPFLSEAWWEIFEGVCVHAKKLGLRLWFYDQIGFSGANFQGQVVAAQPDFAGESLECVTVEGEGRLELNCPGQGQALGAAVWPTEGGAARAVGIQDGRAVDAGQGKRRLRLFYSVRRGFDYFNPTACNALIDKVHGQFERRSKQWFGKVIAGSFQDELPNVPNWGRTFAKDFMRLCGYDILPRLASLFEGETPEDLALRIDYHRTRAALQETAFFKPLFDWHERHGLICGFDQQGDARSGNPSDAVRCYADYLRTHRWYGAPGSDQHGEAKIHSSISHLYGRQRTWIEAFHSSGWGGTLEETFDWLLPWIRAGATLYNPHAVYYSTKGGCYEWAPPSTCWRQPYWKHYPLFASAVSRLCSTLSQGKHLAQVGLLYPSTSSQAGFSLLGESKTAAQAREAYRALVGHMFFNQPVAGVFDQDRRDFDVLDDDSLQRGQAGPGGLSVADETYAVLVLPACSVLEQSSLEALARFVQAGGNLVAVGAKPQWVKSAQGMRPCVEFEAWLKQGLARHTDDPLGLSGLLASLPRLVEAPVPTLRRRVGNTEIVLVPAAHPRATRRLELGHHDPFQYSFDPGTYAKDMSVQVRGVSGSPELWDPFTGDRHRLKSKPCEGGVEVTLPFDFGPAALLIWPGEVNSVPALSLPAPGKAVQTLAGPWRCELLPTLENRFGDLDRPSRSGAPPVQTWYLEHRSESDAEDGLTLGWPLATAAAEGWREAKAGQGVFGWQTQVKDALWTVPPLGASMTASGALDTRGLLPSTYSLSRGIDQDPLHRGVLGPKGHVPEEFLHFGAAKKGQCALFRTSITLKKGGSRALALGSRAAKTLWVNGQRFDSGPGYLQVVNTALKAGQNILEFRLSALEDGDLRAYWALLNDPQAFARPEWMMAPGEAKRDSQISFSCKVDLAFEPTGGTIQVAADAALCRLLVNGHEIGRQGGFDPYGSNFRVIPYEALHFHRGSNELRLEMQDSGAGLAGALVDGLINGPGKHSLAFSSGEHWQATRDQGPPLPALLHGGFWYDPAWCHLQRRPHPLPGAAWLEEAEQGNVVEAVVPNAYPGLTRVEWLRWQLPPGASKMHLPVQGRWRLWVDGKEIKALGKAIRLPGAAKPGRMAVLRVEAHDGLNAGALLDGPVTYPEVTGGTLQLGEWSWQGLRSYSGAVVYQKELTLKAGVKNLTLDLGRVRGTAEVSLNGKALGARFLSPYRFDLGSAAKAGHNKLQVTVYNTLAPYLRAVSPTHYIFPGQESSGLFGPVRILKV